MNAIRDAVPDNLPPNAAELRTRGRAAAGWLLQGYLHPGNVTLLTSLWKAGKTTFLSVLLSKLQAGGTLAGLPLRAGRAVVVSEEAEEHWLARDERLHFGPDVRFHCRPFRGRPTPEQWRNFIDRLDGHRRDQGLDLLAIDPLASFLPGRSENDAGAMLDVLLPLQKLTAAGVAVLLTHHPRKGEPAEGQAARGSGALTGFVDIMIEMSRAARASEDDRRRKLAAYSRHLDTPRRLLIELNADATDYAALGDFTTDEFEQSWQVLFGVLDDALQKLTRRDILQSWPADFDTPEETTLWRWLDRAVKGGQVLQEGTGRRKDPFVYWLPGHETKWLLDPYNLGENNPWGDLYGEHLAKEQRKKERQERKANEKKETAS